MCLDRSCPATTKLRQISNFCALLVVFLCSLLLKHYVKWKEFHQVISILKMLHNSKVLYCIFLLLMNGQGCYYINQYSDTCVSIVRVKEKSIKKCDILLINLTVIYIIIYIPVLKFLFV